LKAAAPPNKKRELLYFISSAKTPSANGGGTLGMTFNELVRKVLETCPTACFEFDNHGQIIIYTGLKKPKSGKNEEQLEEFDGN
jgi:hypothetical protein